MSSYIKIKPSNLTQDYKKSDGVPGVYVWGYYKNKTKIFIPLYVGKSTNLFERMIQHYCLFKSGSYRLFDKTDIEGSTPKPKVIYEPNSLFKVVKEFAQHHAYIQSILKDMEFRLWSMPDSTEEERVLAESILADKIGRNRLLTRVNKSKEKSFENKAQNLLEGCQLVNANPSL